MEVYRGDIFFVNGFGGEITGSEQKQDRPAVVVSNNKANEYSPVIEVVFLTSAEKARHLPTHVNVLCQIPSVALCEQVSSISKTRLDRYIRSCTSKEMARIDNALMVSLGLNQQPKEQVVATAGMIDDLKMKLEGAERELEVQGKNADFYKEECKKANNLNDAVISENAKLLDENNRLKAELKAPKHFDDDSIRLETERDLYKNLYEQLLEKMVG